MTDSDPKYTVELNGKEYELNRDAREAIQTRAEHEYAENEMFSCFWKTADPSQYEQEVWQDSIHDKGDPVLVIETRGPMVPWERLDKLNVEMQEVGPESQLDRQMDDAGDSGGVKQIDPSEIDDAEREVGRTHFSMTPQQFEEVPDPDGEEADKIPAKPEQMGDEPALVAWIPDHPDIDHSWAAGEAICSMHNRVEWNVQKKADQPRPAKDKDSSHDHWESILKSHDCDVVRTLQPTQDTPSSQPDSQQVEPLEGTAGGDNWRV